MGYSARYHAASLAAVFLALAIGILIGVGLGDTVKGTTKDLEQSLKSNLADARSQADDLQAQLSQERRFAEEAYPALVGDLLRSRKIAVVALGSLPADLQADIEAVVGSGSSTGAKLSEVAVVREPPDLGALAGAAGVHGGAKRLARHPDELQTVAQRAGRSLVKGGKQLARFRGALLTQFSGAPHGIDGVVVVRSPPSDLGPGESQATDALENGLLAGLAGISRLPVVGVERSDTDPSQIGFYKAHGVDATVDSVDLVSGRVALAYALRSARGDFGLKSTADRLLPALRRPSGAGSHRP